MSLKGEQFREEFCFLSVYCGIGEGFGVAALLGGHRGRYYTEYRRNSGWKDVLRDAYVPLDT